MDEIIGDSEEGRKRRQKLRSEIALFTLPTVKTIVPLTRDGFPHRTTSPTERTRRQRAGRVRGTPRPRDENKSRAAPRGADGADDDMFGMSRRCRLDRDQTAGFVL